MEIETIDFKSKVFKASQFNEYLGEGDEGFLIYNNLSGAMIEVSKPVYEAFLKSMINGLSNSEIVCGLKKGNFILDEKEDEVAALIEKRDERRKAARYIGLQILPTLGCNFRCIYCYEGLQLDSRVMSESVIQGIVSYVRKTIKPTTKYICVSWYGGEPLLAMRQIKILSDLFIKICDERMIQYFPLIVTNGFLLTERNVDTLLQLKVNICQVTIDGPQYIHDQRRPLKNGQGTYEAIIENLKYAISAGMGIYLRVSIDRSNIHTVRELLVDLQSRGILEQVNVKYALIGAFGNACKSVEENILEGKESADILKSYKLGDLKKEKINRDVPRFEGCIANTLSSLIIGHEGELYKCSKTIGDKKEICGTIFNVDYNHPNFRKWGMYDRFYVDQCRKCSMVPICSGEGCPYDILIKNKGNIVCHYQERHDNYLNYLKMLYQEKQTKANV